MTQTVTAVIIAEKTCVHVVGAYHSAGGGPRIKPFFLTFMTLPELKGLRLQFNLLENQFVQSGVL